MGRQSLYLRGGNWVSCKYSGFKKLNEANYITRSCTSFGFCRSTEYLAPNVRVRSGHVDLRNGKFRRKQCWHCRGCLDISFVGLRNQWHPQSRQPVVWTRNEHSTSEYESSVTAELTRSLIWRETNNSWADQIRSDQIRTDSMLEEGVGMQAMMADAIRSTAPWKRSHCLMSPTRTWAFNGGRGQAGTLYQTNWMRGCFKQKP
jgi:hypothetical protein